MDILAHSQVLQGIYDPVPVLIARSEDQIDQPVSCPIVEDTNLSIVYEPYSSVSLDEEVPCVRVAVEKSILKDHLQDDVRRPIGRSLAVYSGRVQAFRVSNLDPSNSGHRNHA